MANKAPAWQFLLTNLQGTVLGELLNLNETKIVVPLMRTPTFNFTMPLWNSLAPTVMDQDCLVRAYRVDPVASTRKLVFHGPIVSAEENGDKNAQSINVSAAGPWWRMTRRIIPGSDLQSGWKYPATGEAELGAIAQTIIEAVNGAGNTGVRIGTVAGPFPTGTAGPWHLKAAAEAIAELSSGLNSFEFEVVPIEPVAAGSFPYIGDVNIRPQIGFVNRTNAIFEYGTTRANCTSYKRHVDRSNLVNKAYIGSPTWQDPGTANGLLTSVDGTSQAARGLFEDVISDGGIYDNTLRQKLADEHIQVRGGPRQVITFSPAPNARPMPYVDYNVGDFVRGRAVVRGNVRFDAQFRIWGITFGVDKNGNESVEVELSPP